MSTFATIVKFFVDCGPFLYPSLAMAGLGMAIAIERFIFLRKARKPAPNTPGSPNGPPMPATAAPATPVGATALASQKEKE